MKTRVSNTPARSRQKRLIRKWSDPVTLTEGRIYQRKDGLFLCVLTNGDEEAFYLGNSPKQAKTEAEKLLAED